MKKYKIEIKWAIIFIIMTLLWMMMEKWTGLHSRHIDKHEYYTFLIAIPSVLIYLLALLDKRNNYYHGSMTYMQGLITGIIITAIVTILSPLTQYITSSFITPDYFPNAIKYAVDNHKMLPSEAQDYFNLENYIVMGLIGTPVMGILTTALIALFTKKRRYK